MSDSNVIPAPSGDGTTADRLAEMTPRTLGWPLLALAILGSLYGFLAVTSLEDDSVTVDEFGHLPIGWKVLTTGDFRYCTLNPPLMNVLSALPLLFMDMTPRPMPEHPDIEVGTNFWANGYDFMFQHAGQYHRLYVAARCVTVALVGLLGLLGYFWAGQLAPERRVTAGLLAAALIGFSPNILAHARLVTTDAGAACFTALAAFAFHALLSRPTAWRTLACGLALGLAQLVKFNAVLLYPAFVIAAIQWRLTRPGTCSKRLAAGVLVTFVVSVLVINAGYLFHGALPGLGSLELTSPGGAWLREMLPASTPLPLPREFVLALDRQLAETHGGDPRFFFGRSYESEEAGLWHYFVALLAIKTPLPLLVLAGLGVAAAVRRTRLGWGESGILLWPALILLVVLSCFSNKQLGLRMLLPAAPLVWIWASVMLARADWAYPLRWAPAILVIWLGIDVARIHPHYLAYFNPLVGGPSQGHRYALDANLDWGQDLIHLKRWFDECGEQSIQLLYFGRVDPAVYGLNYTVPTQHVQAGYVAVSVSLLGRSYFLNDHGKIMRAGPLELDPGVFGQPVAVIGHTIRVHRIDAAR